MAPRAYFDAQASTDITSSKKAEKWLARVEKESLALVLAWSGTELDPGHQLKPVKIAIIDTGIAKDHDAFKGKFGPGGQIKDHLQWKPGGEKTDLPSGDPSGHGTHTAALLTRLAPQADIYIAQVGETGRDIDGHTVAQAVLHAVNEWKVDMITMSLGFSHNSEALGKAVKEADQNDILLFAAASNGGFNDQVPRKFPARMSYVISVNATNAPGTYAADFNPGLGEEDLATLGIDVPSAWPSQTGCADRRAKSGTSMATPILASFGAAALHFVRQQIIEPDNLPDSDVSTEFWLWLERFLKTKDGMQEMFHCMSSPKQKQFYYVIPWMLFSTKKATSARLSRKMAANHIRDHFLVYRERLSQAGSVAASSTSQTTSIESLETYFTAREEIEESKRPLSSPTRNISMPRDQESEFLQSTFLLETLILSYHCLQLGNMWDASQYKEQDCCRIILVTLVSVLRVLKHRPILEVNQQSMQHSESLSRGDKRVCEILYPLIEALRKSSQILHPLKLVTDVQKYLLGEAVE